MYNLVTDQMLGLAELLGQTSNVWFGPNDGTFFCRTQNFFYNIYIAFFKMATLDLLSLTERRNSFVEIILDKSTV